MKKILLLSVIVFSFLSSFAQDKKLSLGIAPMIAFPTGDFKKYNNTGYGGDFQLVYALNEHFDLAFDMALISFSAATTQMDNITYIGVNMFNMKTSLGARYKIGGFHAGAGLGRSAFYFSEYGQTQSVSGLVLTPEIGYKLGRFDLSGNFSYNFVNTNTNTSNINFFGLKLAFNVFEKEVN